MDPWRWVDPRVRDVRLDGVRAYLARRGYVETEADANSRRFEAGEGAFVLPAAERSADYVQAVVHFLTALSEVEDRHPVAILDEVLQAGAPSRPLRLLWVENHAVFARVAGRQFLSAHEVVVVPTLAAAREELASKTFDAVLLDYDLDDGKGTSLVEAVREVDPAPVVVAVSAHEAGNKALLTAGAKAVCSKTKFAEIEAVLFQAVARRD